MPAPDAGNCEQAVDFPASAVSVSGGYKRAADFHAGNSCAWRKRTFTCDCCGAYSFCSPWLCSAFGRFFKPGTNRIWGRVADAGTGNVGRYCRASLPFLGWDYARESACIFFSEERIPAGPLFDGCLYYERVVMKKKGRYVLEAAFLVPGICILLVHLVFFTLYAHDCAVCVHTALESGIKGCYQDGRTDGQLKETLEKDMSEKLAERLLWLEERNVEVRVNPVRITLRITGTGSFLPVSGLEIERTIYRIQPCKTIRRSRWMREGWRKEYGDTI